MNWTQEQYDRYLTSLVKPGETVPFSEPPPPIRAKHMQQPPRSALGSRMNKTEAAFAQYLQLLKASGEIADWKFEALTFRLADGCRFTPDFIVVRSTWETREGVTLYDVKGRKKRPDGTVMYWSEEDAAVKIKVAAAMWPMFRWKIAYPVNASKLEWGFKEFV